MRQRYLEDFLSGSGSICRRQPSKPLPAQILLYQPTTTTHSILLPPKTMASPSFVPGSQQRYLRACMVCSIVQTHAVNPPPLPPFPPSLPQKITPLKPPLPMGPSEIPPRRLPKLRALPRAHQLDRRSPGMHIASFRGPGHTGGARGFVGGEVAAIGGVCEGGLCC